MNHRDSRQSVREGASVTAAGANVTAIASEGAGASAGSSEGASEGVSECPAA